MSNLVSKMSKSFYDVESKAKIVQKQTKKGVNRALYTCKW